MRVMEPWLISVQFDDREMKACPIPVFRRRLKGTGIELDRAYPITRVAPGRFVGRGFMTDRAHKKLLRRPGQFFIAQVGDPVRLDPPRRRRRNASDVIVFREIALPPAPSATAPPAPELAQPDPQPDARRGADEDAGQAVGLA